MKWINQEFIKFFKMVQIVTRRISVKEIHGCLEKIRKHLIVELACSSHANPYEKTGPGHGQSDESDEKSEVDVDCSFGG